MGNFQAEKTSAERTLRQSRVRLLPRWTGDLSAMFSGLTVDGRPHRSVRLFVLSPWNPQLQMGHSKAWMETRSWCRDGDRAESVIALRSGDPCAEDYHSPRPCPMASSVGKNGQYAERNDNHGNCALVQRRFSSTGDRAAIERSEALAIVIAFRETCAYFFP